MTTTASGQITVTTAGTAVAGPAAPVGHLFEVMAHPGNTGTTCYVGNDGNNDVDSATGYPLNKTALNAVRLQTRNLAAFYFDSDTSGDKVCWVRIN